MLNLNWWMQNVAWEFGVAVVMIALARVFEWATGKRMERKHEIAFWGVGILGLTLLWVIINVGVIKPIQYELSALQTPGPNLRCEIFSIAFGKLEDAADACSITIQARVVNSGSPSVASHWHLEVQLPSGQSKGADAVIGPSVQKNFSIKQAPTVVLDAASYLPNVLLENPVGTGAAKMGWATFRFDDISYEDLKRIGNTVTLRFEDCAGKTIAVTYTIDSKGNLY